MARRIFSISYPTRGITVKYLQRAENKINTYGQGCKAGRKKIWLEVMTTRSTKLSFGWLASRRRQNQFSWSVFFECLKKIHLTVASQMPALGSLLLYTRYFLRLKSFVEHTSYLAHKCCLCTNEPFDAFRIAVGETLRLDGPISIYCYD